MLNIIKCHLIVGVSIGFLSSCREPASGDVATEHNSDRLVISRSDLGLMSIDRFDLTSGPKGKIEAYIDVDGVRSKLLEESVTASNFAVYVQRKLPGCKMRITVTSADLGKSFAVMDDAFEGLATESGCRSTSESGEFTLITGEVFEDGSRSTKLIFKTY